jgi:hypothetical protein
MRRREEPRTGQPGAEEMRDVSAGPVPKDTGKESCQASLHRCGGPYGGVTSTEDGRLGMVPKSNRRRSDVVVVRRYGQDPERAAAALARLLVQHSSTPTPMSCEPAEVGRQPATSEVA